MTCSSSIDNSGEAKGGGYNKSYGVRESGGNLSPMFKTCIMLESHSLSLSFHLCRGSSYFALPITLSHSKPQFCLAFLRRPKQSFPVGGDLWGNAAAGAYCSHGVWY